ncbi:MAG: fibrobacter succinogenes major paralogous domain-containing protein [Prevotella sp.]|jgi:uncharacterized protein (TIGR02145 family)|nr:fibrobacter succinogenes major paralogous domain-containing protein [Prevotella sp.]
MKEIQNILKRLDSIERKLDMLVDGRAKSSFGESNIWKDSILLPGYYTQDEAIEACPKGYRLPTREEFVQLVEDTEYVFDEDKKVGVFTFPDGFKVEFPAAGYRNASNGSLNNVGSNGYYWSPSPNGGSGYNLYFSSGNVYPSYYNYRAYGFSVRCIKNSKIIDELSRE